MYINREPPFPLRFSKLLESANELYLESVYRYACSKACGQYLLIAIAKS